MTIQRSVRTRIHIRVPRTAMNAVKASHNQTTAFTWPAGAAALEQPASRGVHGEDDGQVAREGHEHRPGQPRAVAGTDEHAVDDEDEAGERLAQGHDDQAARDGRLHRGVGAEQRPEHRAEQEQQHAEHDADDDCPSA